MKKLTLLILPILLLPMTALARENVVKLLAESVLSGHINIDYSTVEVENISNRMNHISAENQEPATTPVYVYNAMTDKGNPCFALLVESESGMRVIGYGLNSSMDYNNMPETMKSWLAAYLNNTNIAKSPIVIPEKPVAPIIKTKWHQLEPYNRQVPTYDGDRLLAGCTAVALAQVLYYHKSENTAPYKMEYINETTSTEISVDFSKGGYDWDNMLEEYIEGEYTQEQADAVARLIYEAGVACKSEYNRYSTLAKLPYVALQRFYDYNCDIYLKEYIPTNVWYKIINDDLAAGRPILYGGEERMGDGHAFVIDGVDSEGYYHINWGWGGSCDGYYDITYCQPNDQEGYSFDQYMVAGITPRTSNDEPYTEKFVSVGMCSDIKFNAVTSNCYREDNSPILSCDSGYAVVDAEGNIVYSFLDYCNSSVSLFFPSYYNIPFYYNIQGSIFSLSTLNERIALEDGLYTVLPLLGNEDDPSTWNLGYCPDYLLVTLEVKDGEYKLNNVYMGHDERVEILDMYPASYVYNGTYFYLGIISMKKTLLGCTNVYPNLSFENIETSEVYDIDINGDLLLYDYPDIEQDIIYRVLPKDDNSFSMPAGKYRLIAQSNGTAIDFKEEFILEVEEKPEYPVLDYLTNSSIQKTPIELFHYGNASQDSEVYFKLSSRLYSANTVGGKVRFNIYATPVDGGDEVLVSSLPDVDIKANSSNSGNITLPNNLYPLLGSYYLTVKYMTPEGERELLNPSLQGQHFTVYEPAEPIAALTASSGDIHTSVEFGKNSPITIEVNNNNTDFNGTISAIFIDRESGEVVEGVSEVISIAAGATAYPQIMAQFNTQGNYSVYLTSHPEGYHGYLKNLSSAIIDATGNRAVMELKIGANSVNTTSLNKHCNEIVGIYDLKGRQLTKPTTGINIVKLSNGEAVKIVVR